MRKIYVYFGFLLTCLLLASSVSEANGQNRTETYTGTIISYGSGFNTRTVTSSFTLNITGQTSNQRAQELLGILEEEGQSDLLGKIDDDDLGRFSLAGSVGVPINVVRESVVDGKRRIFIVFERSRQFAEVRGGYRSLDYPFGVIELFIDEQTGKGEGTYIAAASIRMDFDEKKQQHQIEIVNFATFPARLLGVTRRTERKRGVTIK